MNLPIAQKIPFDKPETVFAKLLAEDGTVFFDSSDNMESCGRYSFIALSPFKKIICEKDAKENPFDILARELQNFPMDLHEGLPPFQGGVAGYFSYDLYKFLEKVPQHKVDDLSFPVLTVGLYDLVIAFDNLNKEAWVFSSGLPESGLKQKKRSEKRINWLLEKLKNEVQGVKSVSYITDKIVANFSKEEYKKQVTKVKDYILQGDIFEANISQRFKLNLPHNFSHYDLYNKLRKINPAPFSAYLKFKDTIILSASPERFLKLENNQVETRPIKGTIKRSKDLDEDKKLADELLKSEKDHAENVMIVDLMRNDISRVCKPHSVNVPKLCGLESYATVHHLVSVVKGELYEDKSAIDLLKACFPGGSITGAPKVRAMEIIAKVEPTRRGPYCGSIGYIGFDGNMDTSIVIRTYCIKDNVLTFQAGGAIVLDSDPEMEYEETLIKAGALKNALIN